MHAPKAPVCPEGYPFLFLAGFAALLMAILGKMIPTVICFGLFAFILNFFRDPERAIPGGPGLLAAPADGKVVRIAQCADPVTGEPRTVVCIFMNVFNVHVNRMAEAGTVETIVYSPGKFVNACLDKASEENERCAYLVRTDDGKSYTMVQIAGLIARRIVPWAEEGDRLARGQRFGMIRFGSRVDVYLPQGYSPAIGLNAKTLAGQTVIARAEG